MINLKGILFEKLGVPDNLIECAELAYDEFVSGLQKYIKTKVAGTDYIISSTNTQTQIGFRTSNPNYRIGKYTFTNIDYSISFNKTLNWQSKQQVRWNFFGNSRSADLGDDLNTIKSQPNNTVRIIANMAITPKATWTDLLKYVKFTIAEKLKSTLAHELKHAYDGSIHGGTLDNMIKYRTLSPATAISPASILNNKEFREFMYAIYYTSATEQSVRPGEVLAQLKARGVTKSEFKQKLQEIDVYKRLSSLKKISYQKVLTALAAQHAHLSDDEIKWELDNWFNNTKNKMTNMFTDMVDFAAKNREMWTFHSLGSTDPSINQYKTTAIANFKSNINKLKTADQFFTYYETEIQKNAEHSLRKIAKIYDLLDN